MLWLECYRPVADPVLRLVCFPFAGGAAQMFSRWQAALPDSVEVCAVQPPGRWSRIGEPPYRRVKPLAEAAYEGLEPLLDRPFSVFGHSLGALVGFEFVRLARRRGRLARSLFVSSRAAPQLSLDNPPLFELGDEAFIQAVHERWGGIPAAVRDNDELLALLLPTLRADIEAYQTYEYLEEPPLDCPVCAFGGASDSLVSASELEQWRSQTRGEFDCQLFAGDHLYLTPDSGPLLEVIARRLTT